MIQSIVSKGLLPVAISILCLESSQAALVLNTAMPITHNLRVQPIIVQSTTGGTVEYFGSPAQQSIIEGLVDSIWAQAGIDVTFLSATTYVNDFAFSGTPGNNNPRPDGDLNTMFSSLGAPLNSDPQVLNMFFVQIVPGFPQTSANTSNGLAFLDSNGVAMSVGLNLLSFTGGQEAIASVVAHEIGHNLGLDHITGGQSLMQPGGSADPGHRISFSQYMTVFSNQPGADGFDLLVAIPEPSVGVLGLLVAGLVSTRRKR